jgi:hypothetical protein
MVASWSQWWWVISAAAAQGSGHGTDCQQWSQVTAMPLSWVGVV